LKTIHVNAFLSPVTKRKGLPPFPNLCATFAPAQSHYWLSSTIQYNLFNLRPCEVMTYRGKAPIDRGFD